MKKPLEQRLFDHLATHQNLEVPPIWYEADQERIWDFMSRQFLLDPESEGNKEITFVTRYLNEVDGNPQEILDKTLIEIGPGTGEKTRRIIAGLRPGTLDYFPVDTSDLLLEKTLDQLQSLQVFVQTSRVTIPISYTKLLAHPTLEGDLGDYCLTTNEFLNHVKDRDFRQAFKQTKDDLDSVIRALDETMLGDDFAEFIEEFSSFPYDWKRAFDYSLMSLNKSRIELEEEIRNLETGKLDKRLRFWQFLSSASFTFWPIVLAGMDMRHNGADHFNIALMGMSAYATWRTYQIHGRPLMHAHHTRSDQRDGAMNLKDQFSSSVSSRLYGLIESFRSSLWKAYAPDRTEEQRAIAKEELLPLAQKLAPCPAPLLKASWQSRSPYHPDYSPWYQMAARAIISNWSGRDPLTPKDHHKHCHGYSKSEDPIKPFDLYVFVPKNKRGFIADINDNPEGIEYLINQSKATLPQTPVSIMALGNTLCNYDIDTQNTFFSRMNVILNANDSLILGVGTVPDLEDPEYELKVQKLVDAYAGRGFVPKEDPDDPYDHWELINRDFSQEPYTITDSFLRQMTRRMGIADEDIAFKVDWERNKEIRAIAEGRIKALPTRNGMIRMGYEVINPEGITIENPSNPGHTQHFECGYVLDVGRSYRLDPTDLTTRLNDAGFSRVETYPLDADPSSYIVVVAKK